jgi:hypothetical protein
MLRRCSVAVAATLIVGILGAHPSEATPDDTPPFRVFLLNGTSVASYGEYARVDDKIVFSVALATSGGQPLFQLVTLPARLIDWDRTERYANAARATQYMATRAESDFAALSSEVARLLNEVALMKDVARRLALTQQARRRLAAWPAEHYHYRDHDIRQITELVDEVIGELRAEAGQQAFDLELVAFVMPPPATPLMPAPTPEESVRGALAIAEASDVPAERLTLLRAIEQVLSGPAGDMPAPFVRDTRRDVGARIDREIKVEAAYGRLASEVTAAAQARSARADVRGVERLLDRVRAQDKDLGHQRPDQVLALVSLVQDRLDAARRLRLARDRWSGQSATYRAYQKSLSSMIQGFAQLEPGLDDIKRLAGPGTADLTRITDRTTQIARSLHGMIPPPDLAPVHAMFVSAAQLAEQAARTRQQAVASGQMDAAWSASAAAAGSMMLFGRARQELERLLLPPEIR